MAEPSRYRPFCTNSHRADRFCGIAGVPTDTPTWLPGRTVKYAQSQRRDMSAFGSSPESDGAPQSGPVAQSGELLLSVRRGDPTEELKTQLATLDSDELADRLDTDGARTAFWVNIYNAATQHALAENPAQYDSRRKFFTTPLITVAGRELSLDDIEHGILRRGYSKFTLGYLRRPSVLRTGFFTQHEPKKRDPRIHFVLNCGAESCPAIASYTRERIDEQLQFATEGYLDRYVEFHPDARGRFAGVGTPGRVRVPRVMLWFRGDFGGRSGILAFLRRYDCLPEGVNPRIAYREWDWAFDPADYAEDDSHTD